jgi:hypothetical protein
LKNEYWDEFDWNDADLDALTNEMIGARVVYNEWAYGGFPLPAKGKCSGCFILLEKEQEYAMVWFEAVSDELICCEFDKYNPLEVKIAYLGGVDNADS